MFSGFATLSVVVASIAFALGEELTQDGLPFNFNEKNYKVRKFSMYGKELEDTFGFVSSDYLPLDDTGYEEVSFWLFSFVIVTADFLFFFSFKKLDSKEL